MKAASRGFPEWREKSLGASGGIIKGSLVESELYLKNYGSCWAFWGRLGHGGCSVEGRQVAGAGPDQSSDGVLEAVE